MAARRPRTRRQRKAVLLAAEDSAAPDKIAEPERVLVESLTSEEEPGPGIGKHFHLCGYLHLHHHSSVIQCVRPSMLSYLLHSTFNADQSIIY